MLPKINYETLQKACEDLTEPCKKQEIELPKIPETLPSELGDSLVLDLYRVLYDIHVEEGFLVCPDTGREFAIKDGIPNMILHEDEL
jgi:multifunctional methyltransferase subunit TRM112